MNERKIELKINSITSSTEYKDAFVLLLQEVDGLRQLPVVIGSAESQSLLMSWRKLFPARPMTHQLFTAIFSAIKVEVLNAFIYKIEKDIYYTYLFLKQEASVIRVDARLSDALTMCLQNDAPLFINETLLQLESLQSKSLMNQSIENAKEQIEELQNIPYVELLMEHAVKVEKFELAALLKEKINQLKNRY